MTTHSDVSPTLPSARIKWWRPLALPRTLRGKGVLVLAAALVCSVAATVHVSWLRGELQSEVLALEHLHLHERALAKAEVAVTGASLEVQEATFAQLGGDTAPTRSTLLAIEGALHALGELERHDAGAVRSVRAITRHLTALEVRPVRAAWLDLRDGLRRVQEEVAIQRDHTANQRQEGSARFEQRFDQISGRIYLLLALGLGIFGAAMVLFFTRLTRDIVRLQVRASYIVRGEWQPPLSVARADELGELTRAVNRMADDLESRARQLELEDQRRAHQEKMATLGALAASVAHEINNPLMAIGGVAQELATTESGVTAPEAMLRGRLLLGEVQRLAEVTRRISDVAAPRDAGSPWLDLNALLGPMLHVVQFDPRYRGVTFALALDPQVPAARALAEPVELAVLRLLNEMAAAARRAGNAARVTIRTGTLAVEPGAAVELRIVDPHRAAAPGGIAYPQDRSLKACRAIVESLGGELMLRSDASGLCEVSLQLPAADGA